MDIGGSLVILIPLWVIAFQLVDIKNILKETFKDKKGGAE